MTMIAADNQAPICQVGNWIFSANKVNIMGHMAAHASAPYIT